MQPSSPLADLSLGALATRLPGAAAVFRRCGIGVGSGAAAERTLAEAVAGSAVSMAAMLGALEDLDDRVRRDAPDDPEALIAFIVARHHARHRAELPALIERAAALEAAGCGAPRGLAELLEGLRSGLEENMRREELRVFPLMRRGDGPRLRPALALMRAEHEDNAEFVLRLEELTEGYRPDAGADPAWQALCGDLERFADDLVAHFFCEERLLFPRFEACRG